jgi:hypothetical protein
VDRLPTIRGLWRAKSAHSKLERKFNRAVFLRRFTFAWAIEHAKRRYPLPL